MHYRLKLQKHRTRGVCGASGASKHVADVIGPAVRKIPSIHRPFFCFPAFLSLTLCSQETIFLGLARAAQPDWGPVRTHIHHSTPTPASKHTILRLQSQQHKVSPCCVYASMWSSGFSMRDGYQVCIQTMQVCRCAANVHGLI